MKIIGIGGTNGSGKDTVGQMLADRHGWLFISISEFLREEAKRRKLPVEREFLRKISSEWRRKFGNAVLTNKAVNIFQQAGGKYKGLAISPMRHPGEADRIHELEGKILWVDADPKVRYARIEARLRSPEDHKTFEQFVLEEHTEMQPTSADSAGIHGAAVKPKVDIFLENNGGDIEAFKDEAEKALANFL